MQTKVWAHRGASAYAPENTIEAFQLAVEQGADGIELDVHLSKDGYVVVAHDETLERVSDGTGRIVDHTLAQLQALTFNRTHPDFSRAKMPLLEQVLALIAPTDLTINIEIKSGIVLYEGIEQKTLDLVKAYHMQDRVIYSSFNHFSLMQLRALDPSVHIGLLYQAAMVDPHVYAMHLKADAIHPFYPSVLLGPGVVEGCQKAGVAIHPYTVDNPAHLVALGEKGIEAVITNVPDVARKALGR